MCTSAVENYVNLHVFLLVYGSFLNSGFINSATATPLAPFMRSRAHVTALGTSKTVMFRAEYFLQRPTCRARSKGHQGAKIDVSLIHNPLYPNEPHAVLPFYR